MSSTVAFIVNADAGGGSGRTWLDSHRDEVMAVASGGPVTLVENSEQLAAAVTQALDSRCDTVVAGGGDGTLNAVASRLVGLPVAFGVLPLGTLNHFAKDAGIPTDVSAALECIAAGHVVQVDVAEVNGQYFLNNSNIGLYVDVVRDRVQQQTRLHRGKWPAFAWAVVGALRRYPFLTVTLTIDEKAALHRTPFVFVGNNTYRTEGLQIGQRDGLRDGTLSVYVTERAGRWRLLALGLRALMGRLRQARDFRAVSATELRVDTGHRHLRVAIDGELRRLDAPLHYRIHPGALRVVVPALKPEQTA